VGRRAVLHGRVVARNHASEFASAPVRAHPCARCRQALLGRKDEIDKLLRRGEGWLQSHPEREAIVNRYLRGQRKLTREALARLTEEDATDPDEEQEKEEQQELAIEAPIRLNDVRLQQVLSELKASGAKRVLDLGCGEGKLIRELLKNRQFEEIVGVDVSYRSPGYHADEAERASEADSGFAHVSR